MRHYKTICCLLWLASLPLWLGACATGDINPPQARANTGYLDFHADAAAGLMWEVARLDDPPAAYQPKEQMPYGR